MRRLDTGNGGLDKMWSIISAIGLWANVEGIEELISMSTTIIGWAMTDLEQQTRTMVMPARY